MNKLNTKRTLLRRATESSDGELYTYTLYVSESRMTVSFGLFLYSVAAETKDALGRTRSAELSEAFSDRDKALAFFEAAVKNLILPENLAYIFEKDA